MAKTKRKRELEARDKREGRKIMRVLLIGTAVLMFLMFLMFRGS